MFGTSKNAESKGTEILLFVNITIFLSFTFIGNTSINSMTIILKATLPQNHNQYYSSVKQLTETMKRTINH